MAQLRAPKKRGGVAREGYTRIEDDGYGDRPQAIRPLRRGEKDFATILSPNKLKRLLARKR